MRKLKSEFKVMDLSLLHFYLGLEIYEKVGIFLTQTNYACLIFKPLGMERLKLGSTFVEVTKRLFKIGP